MSRILYFSRSYTPHDHRFLSALANTSHQVSFLQLEPTARQTEDRAVPHGIEGLDCLGGQASFRWRDVPKLTNDLLRVLDRVQPDLIHAGPVQTVGYLAARSGFQPLVTMSWGSDMLMDAERNPWMRRVTAYTLKRTTVFAADCEAVHHKAAGFGFPVDRAVIFPWGVDLQKFQPGRGDDLRAKSGWQDAFVVLSLRTWEPLYGVDVIARGFAKAASQAPDLRLLLLGGGSQGDEIRQIFRQAGVHDNVYYGGQISQNDLPRYYHAADLYTSASHSDGSSVSLMEALACGLPALVSDIPGNREWLEGSPAGWLFPDGDADSLAESILNAYAKRNALQPVQDAARALAEKRANWPVNFQQLIKGYEMALAITNQSVKVNQWV